MLSVMGVAVAMLWTPTSAHSQELIAAPEDDLPDVRDRYEGTGLRAGSFWMLPTLETGVLYDSNPKARASGSKDSWGTYVIPQLVAKSDWGRHALGVSVRAEHYEYFDTSTESHTNVEGALEGRLDVTRSLVALGGIKGGLHHEDRSDAGASPFINAREPVEYADFEVWGSLNKAFNRLSVSIGGAYKLFDYSNVGDTFNGGTIGQNFRDGDSWSAGGRVSYALSDLYRIYVDGRYNSVDYHRKPNGHRSSRGFTVLAGVDFTVHRHLKGHVSAGYDERHYWARNETHGDFAFDGDLIWNATPLMTVTLEGSRRFSETIFGRNQTVQIGEAGRVLTKVKLTVDYEVMRDLIFSPTIGFAHSDITRNRAEAYTYNAGFNIEKKINRHLALGGHYLYTFQDYKYYGSDLDYDRHALGIYAKARF